MSIQSVAVYLGSRMGNDPIYEEKIIELGRWIGAQGLHLIYGGSDIGLMGVIAKAVKEAGGRITGIEPRFFIEAVPQSPFVDELIMTETMPERMTKMIEMSDACIAFPGGIGTLEEVSEVMSLLNLGHLDRPCILYNLNGYYEPLRTQLVAMVEAGFLLQETFDKFSFCENIAEIADCLRS